MPVHTLWNEDKTGLVWPMLFSECPSGRDKTYTSEISNNFSHNDLYLHEAGPGNDQFGLNRARIFSQTTKALSSPVSRICRQSIRKRYFQRVPRKPFQPWEKFCLGGSRRKLWMNKMRFLSKDPKSRFWI